MTVVNIGNIADAYHNGKLPRCGMIILADKEELMAFDCKLLYSEVSVIDAKIAKHYVQDCAHADSISSTFEKQVARCAAICDRMAAEPERTYSHDEVLAIIDELLDGVKSRKGRVKKC